VKFVKKDIRPNKSFVAQLKQYHAALNDPPKLLPVNITSTEEIKEENKTETIKEEHKIEVSKQGDNIVKGEVEHKEKEKTEKVEDKEDKYINKEEIKVEVETDREQVKMEDNTKVKESIILESDKDPTQQPLDNSSKIINKSLFCCRKCRTSLFDEDSVLPHERGEGQEAFSWKKRNNTG
jgi:hypothetical protein